MKTTLLILALMLTGCLPESHTYYIKPNTSIQKTKHDYKQCEYEAKIATASIHNSQIKVMRTMDIQSSCMFLQGYKGK